ncbi:hypothetical protein [Anaerobaca lacustris]|uniref:Uncharacterized protein n=1 Tax=Anaerobaca lacustris TaxID=3044600 RepID=A0AAW6TZT9_9BACT|nr:hypothetical protein [Sedimentisphaerales bacterium M17dextr]
MGRVLLVCVTTFCASCALGQRGRERAYASDDVRVFLAGFRQAVLAHDGRLVLRKYIAPAYRRDQLEGLLNGNRRQFLDELFGLGKNRFDRIVAMEFVCDDIGFEPSTGGSAPNVQMAQCPVLLTYRNGVQVEDTVFVIRYADGDRTFTIDGPRG